MKKIENKDKILEELDGINKENFIIDKENIDNEEAKVLLSQYIESVIRKSLNYIRDKEKEKDYKLLRQIEACNKIINNTTTELLENICSIHNRAPFFYS